MHQSQTYKTFFKLGLTAFLLTTHISQADSASDDAQLLKIMGMSVKQLLQVPVKSAAKHEQTIDQAPSIISVFTRNDIDKMGVTSLIDVLKHAPGIETSMAPDGHWRVDIRGIRKDGNILLLLDEQPFNDFYDGRAIFDLPLSMVEKVEVIRGPGSALYGTNAVAGVVNVTTRQLAKTLDFAVQSHNGYQLTFMDRKSSIDRSFGFNFGISASDGANQVESEDFADPSTDNLGKTNRHIKQAFLTAFYNTKLFKLNLTSLTLQRGPYVGPLFDFGENTESQKTQTNFKASYQHRYNQSLTLTPKLYLNLTGVSSQNEDIVAGSVLLNNTFTRAGFTHEDYSTLGLGVEFQLDYQLSLDTALLAGVSFDRQDMSDYHLTRNYRVTGFIPENSFANHDELNFEQKGEQREVTAIFVQSETAWQQWLLTLGVRFDDYSDFGDSINPRVALVFNPANRLKFKFLAAKAFRAPTFKELYDNTRIGTDGVIGNSLLKAERLTSIELGLEYQTDRYLLRANLFTNDNTDIINLFDSQGGGSIGRMENTGDVKTDGGAAEVVLQLDDNLQLFANISRYKSSFSWGTNPQFDSEREYLATRGQRELFNSPRTRAKVGLDWHSGRWSLFTSANYGAKASHNNITVLQSVRTLQVDEYIQFDASLRYQLSPQVTLKFAANNLGGDKNSDPDSDSNSDELGFEGLLQPPETYHLAISYQF